MSEVSRRQLLRNGALLTAGALAPLPLGCSTEDEPPEELPPREVFLHGVASGDPLPDAVILWTRVTVDGGAVEVAWEVADSPAFDSVVTSGSVTTDGDRDHTVKIDATGLAAGTTYYYRFTAAEETSPIGRCRTAPTGNVERIRFGVCSCSNYTRGYFNAYRRMAVRTDLDFVVHLGDYIYEYEGSVNDPRKVEPPREIFSLDDYRLRYATYRTDPDLQEVHRQHPRIVVWDDHETANDSYRDGAENHNAGEGDWEERKASARQAHAEWMPIREQDDGRLWRKFSFGDLIDLMMLDTRIWGRDQPVADGDDPALEDPDRSILGADQEAWLEGELAASTAHWRVLGQQVMLGQLPQFLNVDQWDGYPAARERLYAAVEQTNNVVVLTGDIHASFGNDLTRDPFSDDYDENTGAGSLGVEVVVPGITSQGFPEQLAVVAAGIQDDNPHMKHVEVTLRGYAVVDIDESRVQADWYNMTTILEVSDEETFTAGLAAEANTTFWSAQSEPTPPHPSGPAPAPPDLYAPSPRDR